MVNGGCDLRRTFLNAEVANSLLLLLPNAQEVLTVHVQLSERGVGASECGVGNVTAASPRTAPPSWRINGAAARAAPDAAVARAAQHRRVQAGRRRRLLLRGAARSVSVHIRGHSDEALQQQQQRQKQTWRWSQPGVPAAAGVQGALPAATAHIFR